MPGSCVRTCARVIRKIPEPPGTLSELTERQLALAAGSCLASPTPLLSPHILPNFNKHASFQTQPSVPRPPPPPSSTRPHRSCPGPHSPTSSYLNHSPQPLHQPDSWQPRLRGLLRGPLPVSASPGPSFLLPWLRLQSCLPGPSSPQPRPGPREPALTDKHFTFVSSSLVMQRANIRPCLYFTTAITFVGALGS